MELNPKFWKTSAVKLWSRVYLKGIAALSPRTSSHAHSNCLKLFESSLELGNASLKEKTLRYIIKNYLAIQ